MPVATIDQDQNIHYYHTDHLGTPQELTNTKGEIVWEAEYVTWGNTIKVDYKQKQSIIEEHNEVALQPLRFQGQYHDQETGLHYNRFRYYDPDVGRFTTLDPIGLLGGDNLYVYAPNPMGWVDPLGLSNCPIFINPKKINYSQRTINKQFDTPLRKVNITNKKNIKAMKDDVQNFPPIRVINRGGQLVARDGNSRLYIAQLSKANEIKVIEPSD